MEFDTLSFDIDSVSTVVKAIGKGPAVIALHGAATIEGHQWARGLADRFRVYLPFHPGFGESGPAPHVMGMQDLVIHYLRLLPALKVDRPHLVGHSTGGWMAAETAAVAGERFNRLVINAAAGLNNPDHPMANLAEIPPGVSRAQRRCRAQVFSGGRRCPVTRRVWRSASTRGRSARQYPQDTRLGPPEPRSLAEPDSQRNSDCVGREGPHSAVRSGENLGKSYSEGEGPHGARRRPLEHAGITGNGDCDRRFPCQRLTSSTPVTA